MKKLPTSVLHRHMNVEEKFAPCCDSATVQQSNHATDLSVQRFNSAACFLLAALQAVIDTLAM